MFHVVLFQPEIPPNTGNIIRLCANTGASLHLIHPLGFSLDDSKLKRAGLDYREWTRVREYQSLQSFTKPRAWGQVAHCTPASQSYRSGRPDGAAHEYFLRGRAFDGRGMVPSIRTGVADTRPQIHGFGQTLQCDLAAQRKGKVSGRECAGGDGRPRRVRRDPAIGAHAVA